MTLVSKTFELYGKTYTFESGGSPTGRRLRRVSRATPRSRHRGRLQSQNYDFFR